MFEIKFVEKLKTHFFVRFFLNRAVYEVMWKNTVVPERLQTAIWRMRIARRIHTLRICSRLRFKCDGTLAETTFRLSAKRTSSFKSAGSSVQSTTGSRGVRMSGSNAGYTTFRSSV
jgi:hypothetical protein